MECDESIDNWKFSHSRRERLRENISEREKNSSEGGLTKPPYTARGEAGRKSPDSQAIERKEIMK